MKYLKQILVCVALAVPNAACSSDHSVENGAAIEATLQIIAEASEHIVIDKNVKLNPIGTLADGIKVFSYIRLWNDGARVSNRVVFIGRNNEYLGAYAVNDFPTKLEGNCVYFPFPSEYGNSICSKDSKLPVQVYLDGENPELFK